MNLLKSLACVSTITFISRILGFARDSIIAAVFGVGMETDAFFVAFKFPNLLRRIFAEGAFSQAFIPILAEYKNQRGKTKTQLLIALTSGMLILVLAIISICGVLAAPAIIIFTAPGFSHLYDNFFDLTSSLLRITFSYIFLISLASMASAILNMWNYFAIPAFAPTLLNLSMIISALYVSPHLNRPILALAWAVLIGGVLQVIYQLPFLKKIEMLVVPRINFYDIGVWRILKKMVPAVIGVSANQLSLLLNTIFASFLVSGSISWMYYADRIMEFPSGVLGATLGTILLPYLSKKCNHHEYEKYSILLDRGLRICLLLAVPSAVALGILAQPLIIVLFQYRKFTAFDTFMTQKILVSYALGLIGIMLVKVLVTGFYSHQDIKTPVKIALITLIISQLVNFLFLGSLKVIGLTLSVSISACLNSLLLYYELRKKKYYIPQPGWGMFLLRLIIAVIIMGITLLLIMNIMPNWQKGIMLMRLLRMTAVILIGASIYFITLFLLGFRLKDLSLLYQ
ncbi:MAG: murein biosynthesis integral membrane protein MurJ [Candidatus Dasytiphilus stammeri]